jgi:predicted tellurium resistance membrane protein TerC
VLNVMASDQPEIGRQGRLAVRLAVAAVVALVVSFGLFGMVWATNGSADRVERVVLLGYLGGVLVSLVAFVLAVPARLGRAARVGGEHQLWTPLWLPMSLFPTLVAIWLLALIEGFW